MKAFLKKYSTFLVIASIVILALLFRVYKLNAVPKSMHNDEIANTYAARFILENGKDMYGNNFPLLYLDKFGDYPPVLAMYVSAAGTFLFGTNEFGSRIGIALVGALFIIPLFLLCELIFKNRKVSVIISLIACILPWHFILSRANAEGIVALTVYTFGFLFILQALIGKVHGQKKGIFLIVGILLFFLTYFIYPSYRIFVPTTLFGLLIFEYFQKKKIHGFLIICLVLSLISTVAISRTSWGQGRFKQTSIFNEVSGVQILIDGLNFNEPNILTARIFNNKAIAFGLKFVAQYLEYFSPTYLFIDGGYSKAYTVPYAGLVYITLLVLVVSAAMFVTNKDNDSKNRNIRLLILYILLTAPIASAFTYLDTPNNHRSLPMVLPLLLFLGYSIEKLLLSKNRIIITGFAVMLMLESVFFFHNYFQHANLFESIYRNDGNKEAMVYVIDNRTKYDKVFVTNNELWLPANYLFFTNNYDKNLIGKFKMNFRLDQIDNVIFPDEKCLDKTVGMALKQNPNGNYLIIDPEGCSVDGAVFQQIDTIKRTNSTTAFVIYKTKPPGQP